MTTHELKNVNEPEEYRGSLIYTQVYGYKLVTITVSVAPDEQSHITSYAYQVPVSEEAERLQGVDMYHFAVPDGTQIQLTIDTPAGTREALYRVHCDTITFTSSHFWTDILPSDDDGAVDPFTAQEVFDEALSYYADLIRDTLQVS